MGIKERISSQVITWWALLIFVSLMFMGSIFAFAFGLFCFVFLFVEGLRNGPEPDDKDWGFRVFFIFFSIIWFLVNLIVEVPVEIENMRVAQGLAEAAPVAFADRGFLYTCFVQSILPLAFFFPVIDQLFFYFEESDAFKPGREKLKKRIYLILLAGSLSGFLASIFIGILRVTSKSADLHISLAGFSLTYEEAVSVLLVLFCSLMISNYLVRIAWSRQPKLGWKREGAYFLGIHIELIVVILFLFLMFEAIWDFGQNFFMASPLVRFLPLLFLFLNLYHEQKSTFFDLFVKRATFFFLSMAVSIFYFGVFLHYSEIVEDKHLFYITFWLLWVSLILLSPWFYGRIDFIFDRIWLNRRESPEALIRRIVQEIQYDTDEGSVLKRAESLIGEMFNTRAEIIISSSSEKGCDSSDLGLMLETRLNGDETARLCMQARPSRIPYYKKERLLLNGLLEFLVYQVKVMRLQNAQRKRDIREKELLLDASKSRLKALRAQINPHFLFNALNAIASFTKTDPDRAETTVELLSEIFRYTLKYSEREWVKLSDELEFISAYLEVEKARFGKRLSTEISMEAETAELLIPAMIVQTLVENAFKHGVSKLKNQGFIKISSVTDGTKLWITVCDNGPGFEDDMLGPDPEHRSGTGMGLQNIQNRIKGYFGTDGGFSIRREGQWTEARIMIPVVEQATQVLSR